MKLIKTVDFVSRWILVAGLVLPLAAHAATVTGTVTDGTTGRPDTVDSVKLITLSQGMQVVASSKLDAQGHFSINLPDNNMHLVRVDHQQASYFEPVPPGTTHVDVTVYDVASKVAGVTTEADVLRMETDTQGLHVIENYFVENDSKPAKTLYGSDAYPIYLPADAQIQGAQAEGPQGMPVSVTPVPLAEKGHYAFVFPMRPGETRFGISYLIPYNGSFTFHPRVSLPTGNLAVIVPNSMSFQAPDTSGFQPIQDSSVKAQTFVAKNVTPDQKLSFTVSGTGSMPRDSQAQSGDQSQAEASGTTQNNLPGGGLGRPIDTPGPLNKYRWWILSALGLVLVVVAAFLLGGKKNVQGDAELEPEENPLTPTVAVTGAGRVVPSPGLVARSEVGSATPAAHSAASASLLNGLKEELFALETERAEGKLTEEQYAELKNALSIVLRRALSRKA